MSWYKTSKSLETAFLAVGLQVVRIKEEMLIVTTKQGGIYYFFKDDNPNNSSGFAFNSLDDSTVHYTLNSLEELIAWLIKN